MRIFSIAAFALFLSQSAFAAPWSFYDAQCRTINVFSWDSPSTWSDCPMQPCELSFEWNDETQLYDTYITPECKTSLTDYVIPAQCGTNLAHTWYYFFQTIKDCWACEIIH